MEGEHMTSYIVAHRLRSRDKDTIHPEQFTYERNAEHYANSIYSRLQLDRVLVLEIDDESRMSSQVFKRERRCKHENIQMEIAGSSMLHYRCMECGEILVGPKEELCTK